MKITVLLYMALNITAPITLHKSSIQAIAPNRLPENLKKKPRFNFTLSHNKIITRHESSLISAQDHLFPVLNLFS